MFCTIPIAELVTRVRDKPSSTWPCVESLSQGSAAVPEKLCFVWVQFVDLVDDDVVTGVVNGLVPANIA